MLKRSYKFSGSRTFLRQIGKRMLLKMRSKIGATYTPWITPPHLRVRRNDCEHWFPIETKQKLVRTCTLTFTHHEKIDAHSTHHHHSLDNILNLIANHATLRRLLDTEQKLRKQIASRDKIFQSYTILSVKRGGKSEIYIQRWPEGNRNTSCWVRAYHPLSHYTGDRPCHSCDEIFPNCQI